VSITLAGFEVICYVIAGEVFSACSPIYWAFFTVSLQPATCSCPEQASYTPRPPLLFTHKTSASISALEPAFSSGSGRTGFLLQCYNQRPHSKQTREHSQPTSNPTFIRNSDQTWYARFVTTFNLEENTQPSYGRDPVKIPSLYNSVPIKSSQPKDTIKPHSRSPSVASSNATSSSLPKYQMPHQTLLTLKPNPTTSKPITTAQVTLNKQRHHSFSSSSEDAETPIKEVKTTGNKYIVLNAKGYSAHSPLPKLYKQ